MDADVMSIIQVAGLQFFSIFGTPEIFYRYKEADQCINSFWYQQLSFAWWYV
jgi:hypothetical protein